MMVSNNFFNLYTCYTYYSHYFDFSNFFKMYIHLPYFSNYYFQYILYPIHQYLNFIINLLFDFRVTIFALLIMLTFLPIRSILISSKAMIDLYHLVLYQRNQQLVFIINMNHNFIVLLFLSRHNHYFQLGAYDYS